MTVPTMRPPDFTGAPLTRKGLPLIIAILPRMPLPSRRSENKRDARYSGPAIGRQAAADVGRAGGIRHGEDVRSHRALEGLDHPLGNFDHLRGLARFQGRGQARIRCHQAR